LQWSPVPAQCSIVIPVYNNWWMTARALRELDRLRTATALIFETIVVDNGSTDGTQAGMPEFPWARYERMEENTNFAGGCNAGAQLATAPLVLFLNNDAYPLGDALTPLVRAFDREEVAIAGGALFFEDGVTQGAGFVVLPNAHWHYACRSLPASLDAVTQSRDAAGVSGAAMAVRRDWFLAGGGFDETFLNGFEDVDLCMRAREAGLVIRYEADARFAHYEGATAGRFDREAENERRFYERWSGAFAGIPRTARGDVGAIAVRVAPGVSPLSAAALEDLEAALRGFGHPVQRGSVRPLQRLDARFRRSASLAWFSGDADSPGVSIQRGAEGRASIDTRGAVGLRVPWLPCAANERVASFALHHSNDAACKTLAIAGFDSLAADAKGNVLAAIDSAMDLDGDVRLIAIAEEGDAGELVRRFGERVRAMSLLEGGTVDVACVLHAGLTDESAFGNVLLAQAELPAVVVASEELRALFAADVAMVSSRGRLAGAIAKLLHNPGERARYGALAGADARRRFSPRRSAIRVVDLLCASRFGLERAGNRRADTPL
jgi:GT2 family glycosyltransferase